MTKEKMIDLIEEALAELCDTYCPYCQSYISPERYISKDDIAGWLDAKDNR